MIKEGEVLLWRLQTRIFTRNQTSNATVYIATIIHVCHLPNTCRDSVRDSTLNYNKAYNQGYIAMQQLDMYELFFSFRMLADSVLVTSQEPLIRNNPSYSLVTTPEHTTCSSEAYEPIDRADSTLHVASNPIYGQHENEYAYPETTLTPDESDNGSNNYYEPTSINQ